MRAAKLLGVLTILAVAAAIGLQLASIKLDNIELRDDLRDIATQNGVNIGLNSPKSDDQVRNDVVAAAAEHGLRVHPDHIALQRIQNGPAVHYNLQVDYDVPLNLLVYSYTLHFTQTGKP